MVSWINIGPDAPVMDGCQMAPSLDMNQYWLIKKWTQELMSEKIFKNHSTLIERLDMPSENVHHFCWDFNVSGNKTHANAQERDPTHILWHCTFLSLTSEKKLLWKILSAKSHPFCTGVNWLYYCVGRFHEIKAQSQSHYPINHYYRPWLGRTLPVEEERAGGTHFIITQYSKWDHK